MKKVFKFGTLCFSIAAFLCACGNNAATETSATTSDTVTESATTEVKETTSESETAAETTESETVAQTEDTSLYAYNYDVDSLVTLGEYKGLTYTKADTTVSDEEVQSQINTTLANKATKQQITDRAVADGDTVNIDYEGLLDGKAFDGGTATGASLTIGSKSYIDGFESGLIGAKPGETVSLNLTFPEEYPNNPDLAGKPVVFNVKVNYINGEDIIPELNDEFVAGLSIENVKTVDDYRAYVRSQLQEKKEEEAATARQRELLQKVVDNAKISSLPEDLVAQYKQEYKDYYKQYAAYFGMEMADFLKQYLNVTEEAFESDAQAYAEQAAGNMLVVSAIAKTEGVDVDALYDEKVAEFVKQAGYADAATLEADYGKNYLKQIIINEAVMSVIEDGAKAEAAETEAK